MHTEAERAPEACAFRCRHCGASAALGVDWKRAAVVAAPRKQALENELVSIARCPGCKRRDDVAVRRIWWRPFRWALLAAVLINLPGVLLLATGERDGTVWANLIPASVLLALVGAFVGVRTVNWINESNRLVRPIGERLSG